MFRAPELGAFFIKAPLRDPPGLDREPNMVRLVFAPDVLTVLGVGLGIPSVVLMSLDPLDSGPFLTGHVFSDIFLEGTRIQRFFDPQFCFKIVIVPD